MTEARPFLRKSPSGPRALQVGAILSVGYDVPIEECEIPGTSGFVPRDTVPNPLQVEFAEFTDGNILEVEYQLSGGFETEDSGPFTMEIQPQVSVDGGATFYFLFPGDSKASLESNGEKFTLSGVAAVKIQDPMPVLVSGNPSTIPVTAPPIVRLRYAWPEQEVIIGGNAGDGTIGLGGACLKASEISSDYVFQGPGGVLATT